MLTHKLRTALFAAALAFGGVDASNAATTLSGDMTVDNLFSAYLSTNDSVLGTLFQIDSDANWQTPQSFSGVALTPGVTNYLHIIGTDQGPPQMFIGDFTLSDSGFKFANGGQFLVTDTTNWKADPGGGLWAAPTGTPVDVGNSPWGGFALIDSSALHIWASPVTFQAYFSTAITPTAAIPEPSTWMLLLSGFGVLLLGRRRV